MKKMLTSFLILFSTFAFAQEKDASVDQIRTQSGIDPTRVSSRAGYSFLVYDKLDENVQINNRISANLGVNRWSFQLKADFVSVNSVPGGGFASGFGDLKVNVLNAFYVKGRSAMAGAVEFGLPTASSSIASYAGMGGYLYATPSLTYSYTINPGLMTAIQPQYSFNLAKNVNYPDMSMLTVRMFVAKFFKSGFFFVLEPRPMYDFKNERFDFIISPILGQALGAGYNLIFLSEIYTKPSSAHAKGNVFQFGLNKSF